MVENTNQATQGPDWKRAITTSVKRRATPYTHEQAALAGSIRPFVKAVTQLAGKWKTLDSPIDRNHAMQIAYKVAEDYIKTALHRMKEEPLVLQPTAETDPEALDTEGWPIVLYQEEMGTLPEQVRGKEMLTQSMELMNNLLIYTERHTNRLTELDLQNSSLQDQKDQYLKDQQFADTASLTGNAAALNWHIDQLNQPKLDYATQIGQILALWPCQKNLDNIIDKLELQDPEQYPTQQKPVNCPGYAQAVSQTLQAKRRMLRESAAANAIASGAMMSVSPQARQMLQDPNEQDRIQDSVSELYGEGLDTTALWTWAPGKEDQTLVAYRFQGITYLKGITENYQHPVQVKTALEHFQELENTIILLKANAAQQTTGGTKSNQIKLEGFDKLLNTSLFNRSILMERLTADFDDFNKSLLDTISNLAPRRTLQEDLMACLGGNSDLITSRLLDSLPKRSNPLSTTQTAAVIQAARDTGASPAAVAELAARLNLSKEQKDRNLVADQPPVDWPQASRILETAYELRPADRHWYRLAERLGWNPESPQVKDLATELDEDRE